MNAEVTALLDALAHPQRAQIEQWRAVILAVDPAIREEIKWNAPSFRLADHFATFKLHPGDRVQLVLHTGARKRPEPVHLHIDDPTGLLTWAAPDRAVLSLAHADDAAVQAIVRQWIAQLPAALAGDLPALSAPARRALAGAGIATLADLARRTEADVAALHGMGPKALDALRDALAARGLHFAAAAAHSPSQEAP